MQFDNKATLTCDLSLWPGSLSIAASESRLGRAKETKGNVISNPAWQTSTKDINGVSLPEAKKFEFDTLVAAPKSRGFEKKAVSSEAKVGAAGWVGLVLSGNTVHVFSPLFIYISILRVRVEVAIGLRFLCQDNLVASSTSGQDVYCTNGWVEYFIISVFRKCWNL